VVASVVLLLGTDDIPRWLGAAIAVGTYLVGILMVTSFRYYSFKEIDFARRRPAGVLVLVVLGVLIVATHPQWFLFLLFFAYALSGPTRPLWARRRDTAPTAASAGSPPALSAEREPTDPTERDRRI
jgi:phosphatidylserine synthase